MDAINNDRIDDYLAALDAAELWTPIADIFPPSFDEWNATRLATGNEPGTFEEYLIAIEPGFDRARKQDNE